MMDFHHITVLLDETIEQMQIDPSKVYLDGTLGGGGHASAIAAKLTTGRLIGLDRDEKALTAARERLAPWMDRVTLLHRNFRELDNALDGLGLEAVDGMVFDPVSYTHLRAHET